MEENQTKKKLSKGTIVLISVISVACVAGFSVGIWALTKINSDSSGDETTRNKKIASHLKDITNNLLKNNVNYQVDKLLTFNYSINNQEVKFDYTFMNTENHCVIYQTSFSCSSFSIETLFEQLINDNLSALTNIKETSRKELLGPRVNNIQTDKQEYVVNKSATYYQNVEETLPIYSSGVMTKQPTDFKLVIYTDGVLKPDSLIVDLNNAKMNEISLDQEPNYYKFSNFLSKNI